MKRLLPWTLVVAFAVCCAGMAHAEGVEVKVKGEWDFAFGWAKNTGFANSRHIEEYGRGDRNDDPFMARQRIRTQLNFIVSEYLQGVVMFQIGDINWGRNPDGSPVGLESGGALDTDGVNIGTRLAYLDFLVPHTDLSVRMGLQMLPLPSATELGNPIFGDDQAVAGVAASYAFSDTVALTGFWARPYDKYLNDSDSGYDKHYDDEMDMFGLLLPITLEGVSITPWGLYASIGSASGYHESLFHMDMLTPFEEGGVTYIVDADENQSVNGWWTGLAVAVDMWDPLTFSFDAMYGRVGRVDILAEAYATYPGTPIARMSEGWETRGWFLDARLDYTFDWGVAGLFGWWSSGDDADDIASGKLGRMPIIAPQGFGPTSFGFDGAFGIADGAIISNTGIGTWGIGMQLADVSFVEDLSHTLRFAYYRGTNDSEAIREYGAEASDSQFGDGFYLTDKDQAFEVNFDHTYQVYENLTAVLELGYIHLDLDKNTWNGINDSYHKTDDAWKAQLSLQYSF